MANTLFDHETMIKRMQSVIVNELTDWQQTVVRAIYFEGKTQTQLAQEFGLNRSSVCRTLQRAEQRLRKFLAY